MKFQIPFGTDSSRDLSPTPPEPLPAAPLPAFDSNECGAPKLACRSTPPKSLPTRHPSQRAPSGRPPQRQSGTPPTSRKALRAREVMSGIAVGLSPRFVALGRRRPGQIWIVTSRPLSASRSEVAAATASPNSPEPFSARTSITLSNSPGFQPASHPPMLFSPQPVSGPHQG